MHTDLPHHGLPAGAPGHISRLDNDGRSSAVSWYWAVVKTGFPHAYIILYDHFLLPLRQKYTHTLSHQSKCDITKVSHTSKHTHTPSHFEVDLVHQCDDEGVEISQEEGEDASQLPLQGDTRVVVLQGADDVKQHGAEHPQQGHDHVNLRNTWLSETTCHMWQHK